jgi:hypothetical protein
MLARASYVVVSATLERLSVRSLVISWWIALVAGPALAGTFAVFGPRTYQRTTGAPIAEHATFSGLNPSGAYLLRIRVERVASAVILLNGVTVGKFREILL